MKHLLIDWSYPLLWGIDLESHYKSLWLGWWLVTWTHEPLDQIHRRVGNIDICFQPGL